MNLKYFSIKDTKELCHKRYKDLCKIYHPDTNSGNVDIMAEINNEYNFITTGKEPDPEPIIKPNPKKTVEDLSKIAKEITLEDILNIGNVVFDKKSNKKNEAIIKLMKKYKLIP